MDSPAINATAGVAKATTTATAKPQSASSNAAREVASEAQQAAAKKAEAASQEPLKPQRDPRSLQFQVDGGRIVTTILDEKNNTVVEQIPDAEVIRLAAAIDRLKGFFLQEKA